MTTTSYLQWLIPPLAAAGAIIPVYRDFAAKSALQQGKPVEKMHFFEAIRGGLKTAPTVGILVGSQMIIQGVVEKALTKGEQPSFETSLTSSAIVGIVSLPVLAVFNGKTMGWTYQDSLKKFTPKQGMAIAVQETAFIAGIAASEPFSKTMKAQFGDNLFVAYTATFIAGAIGSLVGHPANTALTRWQNNLKMESVSQSMWGSLRKARAVGCFSVFYKAGKEILTPN